MADVFSYEKLYQDLKEGKNVTPVSREEVLMMTLIDRLANVGADEETTEQLQLISERLSAISETRSLKKFIDSTANLGNVFGKSDVTSYIGIIDYDDTNNLTSANQMFYGARKLETIPLFDTSKVTSMSQMFRDCNVLSEIPLFDTSKVTSMDYMFGSCAALKTIPLFDTSKVTSMGQMFEWCTQLETIPLLDTSHIYGMYKMFYSCKSLKTIPELDIRTVSDSNSYTHQTFYNCQSLETCLLRNIKASIQVGSGTSYGHLLTVDSLIHLIYELRDTGKSKTLTIGSANLAKITDVYVKTIDITDEMRAEDDLIDEKLPFEVCESTDEGAHLITEYATLKNWQIA